MRIVLMMIPMELCQVLELFRIAFFCRKFIVLPIFSVAHKIRCEPMEFVARLQSNLKGETSEVLVNWIFKYFVQSVILPHSNHTDTFLLIPFFVIHKRQFRFWFWCTDGEKSTRNRAPQIRLPWQRVETVRGTLIGTLRDMEMVSRKNDDTENDDIISTSYPPLPCLLIR